MIPLQTSVMMIPLSSVELVIGFLLEVERLLFVSRLDLRVPFRGISSFFKPTVNCDSLPYLSTNVPSKYWIEHRPQVVHLQSLADSVFRRLTLRRSFEKCLPAIQQSQRNCPNKLYLGARAVKPTISTNLVGVYTAVTGG
jgi:hypothetical protein